LTTAHDLVCAQKSEGGRAKSSDKQTSNVLSDPEQAGRNLIHRHLLVKRKGRGGTEPGPKIFGRKRSEEQLQKAKSD